MPRVSTTRATMRSLLAWSGIFVVFLVVLEITCRVEDWVMYRTPLLARVGSLNDLLVRDAEGMHARPHAEFQKWKINSLGTRGPERALVTAPGTLRVITVGASETFGLRETPNHEYPRQLEDSLSAWVARNGCAASPPPRFEVLNAAFAGMSLPTIEQDIRLRLRRLRPDIIVIYPSSAQYLEDEVPIAAKPDSSPSAGALPRWSGWKPRVWDRFREQVKLLVPDRVLNYLRGNQVDAELRSHPPGWRFSSLPVDRLAIYDRDLRRVIGTVRGIGAQPVLVTHGNIFMNRDKVDRAMLIGWEKFYPRAPGRIIVAFDFAARTITRQVGADSGVVTVDAATRLAAAPTSIFADFVHFTDSGAALMADEIRHGVIAAATKKGLIACGAGS